METNNILPAITLYQPWATWIMREWKTIETRTHAKFAKLKGQRILIHAGKVTDGSAATNPYLTPEQIMYKPEEVINGFILGSAFVHDFKPLNSLHSRAALIDCDNVERWGLFLSEIKRFDIPIKCSGEVSIWYFDMLKKAKLKK